MTVAIEMGHTTAGAPATLDLEELLATRLLVQGNSGSGKSHLLRRLLEQSAPWVQQTIIDPEGDFVALAERFGHLLIDAEDHTERGLQVAGERARIHRVSTVLNLEGLDAENQMRRAAAFLGGLFDVARDHWYPMLVVVDEAQLFAPAVAGEVTDEARETLARRHDEPDVPWPQTRTCGKSSPPSDWPSLRRTSRPRRPIS